MTLGQAMQKAIKHFEREAKKRPGAEIRNVKSYEMSGRGNSVESATFKIDYAIDGDYTQSDKYPYLIHVFQRDGKVCTEAYVEK